MMTEVAYYDPVFGWCWITYQCDLRYILEEMLRAMLEEVEEGKP